MNTSVFLIGLGVTDPIGVFGSTKGLKDKHGDKTKDWWFDTHGIDLDEL